MSNEALWSQANHTLTLIGQQNPTSEHIKTLHDGAITDLVQAIMNARLPSREKVREFYGLEPLPTEVVEIPPVLAVNVATTHTGILTVNYALSLEQMIAAGHYGENGDNWNKDITTAWFPIVGTGIMEFEWKVFDFGRNISSASAVKEIRDEDKTNPWEPAKTEHTLAYGAQFPKEQRKHPIIGLGSAPRVFGYRNVLELNMETLVSYKSRLKRVIVRAYGYRLYRTAGGSNTASHVARLLAELQI